MGNERGVDSRVFSGGSLRKVPTVAREAETEYPHGAGDIYIRETDERIADLESHLCAAHALLAAKDEALRKALPEVVIGPDMPDDYKLYFRVTTTAGEMRELLKLRDLTPADALKRYEAMERVVEAAKAAKASCPLYTCPPTEDGCCMLYVCQALAALEEVEK